MVYTRQQWSEFLAERDSGREVEVDEDLFNYFLEVLPLVGMPWNAIFQDGTKRRCAYGFAEGYEKITAFYTKRDLNGLYYFCRLTVQDNPYA